MVLSIRAFFQFLLVLIAFQGLAQVSFDSQEELEKAANTFFDSKDYAKAKPLFSQLLSKDALNPDYNYRFGVCILFTEADPLKPLPYIEGGASTAGVNVEAHYFLGKAFQLNYRFDDAIRSFEKGKSLGFNRPDIDLNRSIEECRNGKIHYNAKTDFQPAMDKEVIASEFYRPYDFRKLKGKVIAMPANFKTKYDEKHLTGTVVYTPTNSQTLVYASYGEDGSNGKDLYRVNRLPNGELALPSRLPSTINTPYDEDYAFYDEESQILFFASKGHNSMGGYDVFSSKYNPNNDTWSVPLNLQYPINSPYDDFLYVSDPEGEVAFFATSRNVEPGKLRVLKTLLHDPQQVEVSIVEGTFIDKIDTAYNYASLTVLDPLTKEVVGKYRSHKETGKYLLVLPPQNDYVMDVGPKEADGFKFDLDVPKPMGQNSLKQEITYNATGGEATVSLTNYFDATGKPDTVKFTESMALKSVEERMVAMPDPTELLASRAAADEKKKEAERLAMAAKQELAEKAAAKKAEEEALKQKRADEEARKQQELALAEQARLDSIRMAEKQKADLAAKEAAAKAEQAEQLAAAEKAKQLAESERLKTEKEAAEKAQQAEQLAQEQAEKAALKAKQEAEEKAQQLAESERLKAEKEASEKALQAERLAQEQAEKAALKAKQEADEKAKQLAESERLKAEQEAAEKAQQNMLAEKLRSDSIALAENQEIVLAQDKTEATSTPEEVDFVAQAREKFKRDSIQQVEEFEKLRASHLAERARRDSVEQAMQLAAEREKELQAQRDSAAAADLIIEQERLAQLQILRDRQAQAVAERTAEAEKAQQIAKQEALGKQTESRSEPTKAENDPIASETKAANKPAELKTQPVTEATTDAETEKPSTDLATQEVLSESDIFLQTIAKLEAQKREQEKLIEAENNDRQKQLTEQRLAQEQAKRATDTTGAPMGANKLDAAANSENAATTAQTADATSLPTALKSDAKPDSYLAALAEIEQKIAKDAATNAAKNYELKELPASAKDNGAIDPVLKAKIESDRQALSEHQKIAVEKEEALKAQMQRDRATVESLDQEAKDELASVEAEILQQRNAQNQVATETNEQPKAETDVEAEKASAFQDVAPLAVTTEEAVQTETVAQTTVETPVPAADQEVLDALAEFDRILSQSDPEAVAVENGPSTPIAPVADVAIDNADQQTEDKPATESKTDSAPVASQPSETQPVSEHMNEMAYEEARPRAASTGTVGTIPFLKAASRSYQTTKPSFDRIEDPSMRRMIQRMRAEDIGRMAVLKNMKNQWVEAGKNPNKLKEIKSNIRNQDVLASLESVPSREEYIRPPFDKNDLKQREDVHYKIGIVITMAPLSQTVSESMTPEQAISFAMPEFDLQTGYYLTLADVTSELKHYKNRGFENVKIIPFLNNEPVPLSVVYNIPFVD